jgi:hypothetical protein
MVLLGSGSGRIHNLLASRIQIQNLHIGLPYYGPVRYNLQSANVIVIVSVSMNAPVISRAEDPIWSDPGILVGPKSRIVSVLNCK